MHLKEVFSYVQVCVSVQFSFRQTMPSGDDLPRQGRAVVNHHHRSTEEAVAMDRLCRLTTIVAHSMSNPKVIKQRLHIVLDCRKPKGEC